MWKGQYVIANQAKSSQRKNWKCRIGNRSTWKRGNRRKCEPENMGPSRAEYQGGNAIS